MDSKLYSIRSGLVEQVYNEEIFKNKIKFCLDDLSIHTIDKIKRDIEVVLYEQILTQSYRIYAKKSGIGYSSTMEKLRKFNIESIIDDMTLMDIIDYIDTILNCENFVTILMKHMELNKYYDIGGIKEFKMYMALLRKEWVDTINETLSDALVNYKFDIKLNSIVSTFTEYQNIIIDRAEENLFEDADFELASKEFKDAYINITKNQYKDCILNINKALESVLKVICIKLNYTKSNNEKMGTYLSLLRDNNFYGDNKLIDNNLTNLIKSMDSGLPTIRNKTASHGSGIVKNDPTEYLTRYAFFSGINAINLIIEIYKEHINEQGSSNNG